MANGCLNLPQISYHGSLTHPYIYTHTYTHTYIYIHIHIHIYIRSPCLTPKWFDSNLLKFPSEISRFFQSPHGDFHLGLQHSRPRNSPSHPHKDTCKWGQMGGHTGPSNVSAKSWSGRCVGAKNVAELHVCCLQTAVQELRAARYLRTIWWFWFRGGGQ